MSEEIWRDITGYEGLYQVSNCGRVKSFYHGGRILKQSLKRGYMFVELYLNTNGKIHIVHRLVAQAFIPNPLNKLEVNHINGIKTDNRVENLEWVTRSENEQHAYDTGLAHGMRGENNLNAKLTNEQARYIRENPDKLTGGQLAKRFGITPISVSEIQRGKTYADAGGTIRKSKCPPVPDEVREQIRRIYVQGSREFGLRGLARKYGVSQSTIWRIVHEEVKQP